jgi:two-component system, OmpR family, sensor histidine kinase KdpD
MALGCPWTEVRLDDGAEHAAGAAIPAAALLARVVDAAREHLATAVLIGPTASTKPFAQQLRRALPDVAVHVIDPDHAANAAGRHDGASAWHAAPTALAVLALCTLISWLLAPYFEPANLIMVYLAGVVHVALRAGRPVALLTVVGSVILYDLLFIAPSDPIKPSEPHYVLVSVVMLLVGFIVSHLAARSRQQAAMAESRAQRAQALNHLALELVKARTPASIGTALALALHRTLGVSAHVLPVDGQGQLDSGAYPFPEPMRLARAALQHQCDTGTGTTIEPKAPYRCLLLRDAEGPLGVVAVDLLAREHDTLEDQQLLKAAANQVAIALARAVFEQRSARDAVQAESERRRNTLLAGISHDFRTPLTTIVGAATSLLEQGHAIEAEQRTALLRSVLAEARRMNALTSNLLDLTRMQEGAIVPSPEWCPADELVEEALTALAGRLAAHTVSVQTPPDAVVWCDPSLVGQLLVNLLDNATRYAPGSAIAISVDVAVNQWQLVVQDHGPGIPEGQEREVFKKFFRGSAGAASGGGTGLGLAICAAVAHLHGGTLAVGSGPGARLVLTLPQPALRADELAEVE